MSDKVKDLTKIRKKDKRRTVFKVIGLLVLVILLIAGILFTKPYWTPALDTVSLRINRIIHSSEEDGEFATKNFPVEISSDIDYQVARMDNYFALLSDTHLYLYNLDGELSDDRKYSYKNPVLKEADKKTLIYGKYRFRDLISRHWHNDGERLVPRFCQNLSGTSRFTAYLSRLERSA